MAIENTVSVDFDPRSSIVKSVFDCRLSGVVNLADTHLVYKCCNLLMCHKVTRDCIGPSGEVRVFFSPPGMFL